MDFKSFFSRDNSSMKPYNGIKVDTFANASVIDCYKIYKNKASWVDNDVVRSLNLARGIVKEVKNASLAEFDYSIDNELFVYDKLRKDLRLNEDKAVEALLVGGRVISKPYIKDGMVGFTIANALEYKSTYDSNNDLVFVQFQSKYTQGGFYFTLNEEHTWYKNTNLYVIKYYLYKSQFANETGKPCELAELVEMEGIESVLEIEGVTRHLCTEVILDAPVFFDAIDLIKSADEQYSRMLWEFQAGEMAIDVSADLLKKSGSSALSGVAYDLPKGKERLYRKMVGANSDFGMQHWAPQLRDESYARGLDKILRRIEFSCGLAYGTISESSDTEKTATEILASKQRFYVTITTVQTLIKDFISNTADAVSLLTKLLHPSFLALDIVVSYSVGDSILTDRKEQIDEKLLMVEKGVITLDEFKVWYSKI